MSIHRTMQKLATGIFLAFLPMLIWADKLVVYGDESYAPVIFSRKGQAAGILPAIFERIARETGDSYELILVPWKRALTESMRGHGGITGISRTNEREKIYDFSAPIYDDDIQLVVLKGREFTFSSLKDLQGKTLGGAQGASYGDALDQALTQGTIVMDRDPHQLLRLKKLLLGRIDVAMIGNGAGGFEQLVSSDPELSAHRSSFVVLPQVLVHDALHLAFIKSMAKKAALQRFDKALDKFKKTADYRRIVGSGN